MMILLLLLYWSARSSFAEEDRHGIGYYSIVIKFDLIFAKGLKMIQMTQDL